MRSVLFDVVHYCESGHLYDFVCHFADGKLNYNNLEPFRTGVIAADKREYLQDIFLILP